MRVGLFFLFLFIHINNNLICQESIKNIFGSKGTDRGVKIQSTADNGFVIIGYSTGERRDEDVYLIKLDSTGSEVWSQQYGGKAKDNGWAILQMVDKGFFIAGFSDSFGMGDFDVLLIRTDSLGNDKWVKTFGGEKDDKAWDIVQDSANNFLIVGETESFGKGNNDIYLLKIDIDGNLIWQKTFGGAFTDRCFAIKKEKKGNFIIGGMTDSAGEGDFDACLLKVDPDGNEIWFKSFGEENTDIGHDVQITSYNEILLSGYSSSYNEQNNSDTWLIRVNQKGNEISSKIIDGKFDDRTLACTTKGDNIFLLGYSNLQPEIHGGNWDIFLIKLTIFGELEWRKDFGSSYYDECGQNIVIKGDSAFFTGRTFSNRKGNGDVFIIKVLIE